MIAGDRCSICGRVLDNTEDPLSKDCGGDCLSCMADAGDPDCEREVRKILRQIKKAEKADNA